MPDVRKYNVLDRTLSKDVREIRLLLELSIYVLSLLNRCLSMRELDMFVFYISSNVDKPGIIYQTLILI